MSGKRAKILWVIIFSITLVVGIPWFLWDSSHLLAGVPVWVLYHAGWLAFLIFLFWLFVRTYWKKKESRDE